MRFAWSQYTNEQGQRRAEPIVALLGRLVYHIALSVAFKRHGTKWQITTFVWIMK